MDLIHKAAIAFKKLRKVKKIKMQKNEHVLDRLTRVLIGEVLLLAAFFWAGDIVAIVLYFLGAVMLITAVTGFCMLYKPFGINTLKKSRKKTKKIFVYLFLVLFLLIAIVGSYASNFFSKKIFLNDFNAMNNYYKQTLFFTGQDKRQISIENYNKLVIEYNKFYAKYSSYHPYALKGDSTLNQDLANIVQKITSLKEKVNAGDLKQAHKDFETIRPVLQDILKRNNFSLFAAYLVDFHDSMEKVIDASDKKDAAGVIATYNDADQKLIAVEQEANDDEIKTIRTKLEELLTLAKSGNSDQLSKKAAELKSSFVKVYLKRG